MEYSQRYDMPQDAQFSYNELEWVKILTALRHNATSDLGVFRIDRLKPASDHEEIERRLRINSECQHVIQTGIPYQLSGCSDVGPVLKNLGITGMPLSVEAINRVVENLDVAWRMRVSFKDRKDAFPELFALTQKLKPHEKIVKDIRKKIDENGTVLDSASPELKRHRRKIQQLRENLKKRLEALVKQAARNGLLQEEHYTIRNGRYVLPVKETHQRQVQGITHDISSTGATLFIEPLEIVERNNEISMVIALQEEEIRKIISKCTDQLREIARDIGDNQEVLARLDMHHSCGMLAYRLNAQKPAVSRSNVLILQDARHPLLLLNTDNFETVIPLSVTLGDSFKTLVISGPNAGGKTVTLKTIGLLCLMVQCGLPVPASADSQFPVFKRIIAEIGDLQSLDDNLSTFSARLLHVKAIMDALSGNDLILLDELGTGTDPQEGVNLAMAIINYITSAGALMVVTTHHGGLKLFANETESVENASLAFDEDSLKPTFQLTVGIPGSSYALELSRRIGLPEKIINDTRSLLGEEQLKIEDFLRELETRISFYKKKNSEIAERQNIMDKLIEDYNNKLRNQNTEYHTKLSEAVKESESRMVEFNRRFEKLVKDIRKDGASHESIIAAKKAIQKETGRIRRQHKRHRAVIDGLETEESAQDIDVGSTVQMKGHHQTGVVIAENKRKNTVTVQMDSLKLEVKKERLHVVKKQFQRKISESIPVISVKSEIDLRGLQSQEAIETVDHYLADAVATGLTSVRIIHGKGTGSLRKSIGEFLKHDDRIVEYRLGSWGEGDTGVTIVQLK